MDGVLNLLKPPGMSSHDAVVVVRKMYAVRRVGHGGTLDPAAAGVLPVFLGRAVRLAEFSANHHKAYRFEMILGVKTASFDLETEPTETREVSGVLEADVLDALKTLVGEHEQEVPAYSAVRVGGRKLYDFARSGETAPVVSRKVHIQKLDLLQISWEPNPRLLLDMVCSKGTFVRAVCRDIGRQLGVSAVVSFLLRTASGPYGIENSHTFEEIEQDPSRHLLPMHTALEGHPRATVSDAARDALRYGRKPAERDYLRIDTAFEGDAVAVFSTDGVFLAVGEMRDGSVYIRKVFYQ